MINVAIKDILLNGVNTKVNNSSLGYNVGKSGEILYKTVLAEQFDVDIDIETNLQEFITALDPKTYKKSFASNFYQDGAEIGRLITFLEKRDRLTYDYSSFLNKVDTMLIERLRHCIFTNNFEPTEGALGIGYYFLQRLQDSDIASKALQLLISTIMEKKKADGTNGYYWICTLFGGERAYLGWHGVSSFINFLLEVSHTDLRHRDIDDLLAGACAFLVNNRFSDTDYTSTFPLWKGRDLPTTNLCILYGDLSTAIALLKAGQYLGNETYSRTGLDASLKTISRQSEEETAIRDSSILYGASGTALQYKYIHHVTQMDVFTHAANYWIDIAKQDIQLANQQIELKRYFFEDNDYVKNSIGFGSLGVSLSILLWDTENKSDINNYLFI